MDRREGSGDALADVIQFPCDPLYEAHQFSTAGFAISGTLCGCIDMACPSGPTFCLTPDEVHSLTTALMAARHDVLANSRPFSDPRLYEASPLSPIKEGSK